MNVYLCVAGVTGQMGRTAPQPGSHETVVNPENCQADAFARPLNLAEPEPVRNVIARIAAYRPSRAA